MATDYGAHLNGGSLSSQRQTAADTQNAAAEFYREQPESRGAKMISQHRFQARNSAAGGLRSKSLGQVTRNRCARTAKQGWDDPTDPLISMMMCPADHFGSSDRHVRQSQAIRRANKSRNRP